jgi:toxin ParE1/3/4
MTPEPRRTHVSRAAVRDFDDIDEYLAAQGGLDLAERFNRAAQETFRFLLRLPGLGVANDFGNPELAGLRMQPVRRFRNYLIFYRPTEDGIDIVRVLHGSRDLDALFSPPPDPA